MRDFRLVAADRLAVIRELETALAEHKRIIKHLEWFIRSRMLRGDEATLHNYLEALEMCQIEE